MAFHYGGWGGSGGGGGGGGVSSVGATAPITTTGGATPNIGINPATTLLPGSMSAADKARFDQLGSTQLVYRPGGVSGAGVAATWAEVDAFAAAAQVPWTLFYDDSISPATVPATSTTDFRGLVYIQGLRTNTTPLTVLDGGFIANFNLSIAATIACEAITRSGAVFDIPGAVVDFREGGRVANILGVSLVPAVEVNVASNVFALLTSGGFQNDEPGVAVVEFTVVGGFFIIASVINTNGGFPNVPDNSIIADPTSTIFDLHDSTAIIGPQSGFAGTTVRTGIAQSNLTSWASGDTASRPSFALQTGQPYFDTDLGFPVWWNGTVWVSAAGIAV